MVFEDLASIKSLSPNQRLKRLGSLSKPPCPHRRHRSNMMLNPLNLKHLNRLDELDADWVTLNLEDAIAPSRKREALINIALFLSHLKSLNSRIIVRVNPLECGGEAEIRFLNDFAIDAIRLPKVRNTQTIKKALGLLNSDRELHISIETKEAFRDIAYWGGIDPRLKAANLGILDLLADLGLAQSLVDNRADNPTVTAILSRFLLDAKIANLLPVSFMYQDYKDLEGFRRWCQLERKLGFEAKACLGPAQVAIANEIFGANEQELERARYIKEAFESASAKGIHGFLDERYGFIDEPLYRDALKQLSKLDKI